MIEIQGAYNSAIVYTENLEELARSQIQSVCDQEVFVGCKLRIMPDVHAGKGCTIGTTMTIRDKIVPGTQRITNFTVLASPQRNCQ